MAFLTTGAPDPTQGGSGLFNYQLCKAMLERGWNVRGYFRLAEWFESEIDPVHLRELSDAGLTCEIVREEPSELHRPLGLDILRESHQVAVCRRVVERDRSQLEQLDGLLALDLGWAVALADVDRPTICMLGDPLEHRLRAGHRLSLRRRATWRTELQLRSLRGLPGTLAPELSAYDGERRVLGHLAPQHAQELREAGIPCRHFPWFTPDPGPRQRTAPEIEPLVILHVGSLATTASRSMLAYWERDLFPVLDALPFPIVIRFVGKAERLPTFSGRGNLRMELAGHVASLDDEFDRAALFFSPMKYGVGIRTRVVTALSFGVPVLADETTASGLPELEGGREILYASTPAEVAATVSRIAGDRAFAESIGTAGRRAWERHYNPAVNIPVLLDALGID